MKKKNRNSKWAILGLALLAVLMLSIVLGTNASPKPVEEEKLSSGEDITVSIEALIDGPRVCFARVRVDGEDKYVNLGGYPACQEHQVGQEITVNQEDIDDFDEIDKAESK